MRRQREFRRESADAGPREVERAYHRMIWLEIISGIQKLNTEDTEDLRETGRCVFTSPVWPQRLRPLCGFSQCSLW